MRALALVCLGITILAPQVNAETRTKAASASPSTIRTGSTNTASAHRSIVALPANTAATATLIAASGDATKRSFAVQLDRRETESNLLRIATEIRDDDAQPAASAVVMFYLPGMKVGHGVWAHAFFPKSNETNGAAAAADARLTIVGLTMADEERLTLDVRRDPRNLVGAWLTTAPAPVGKLSLFRDKGRLFAEWSIRDGRRFAEEVVETALPGGDWRYDRRVGGAGDHMLMTANGDLELRDRDDVATSTEVIKREPGDFNLAVAQSNQARVNLAKIADTKVSANVAGKRIVDHNPTAAPNPTKGTVVVSAGSVVTLSDSTLAPDKSSRDKATKKTAQPTEPTPEANKLADVIFR